MKRLWTTWVEIWSHEEVPRSLAIIRILVGACLVWDFAWIGLLDLVVPILAPEEAGGWARVLDRGTIPLIWQLAPPTAGWAWALYLGMLGGAVCVTFGVFTPVSALVLMMLYAQSAETLDAADRGIDMMMRNVLMLLAFSSSHRMWSFDAWRTTGSWRGDGAPTPAWPRHLLVLQLIVMYFIAGIAKIGSTWTPMGEFAALYAILQDPAVARFDGASFTPVYPLTQLSTAITISWEYSAPLMVLVYWYRHTWDRPGRLRAFCNRWRVHWIWLSVGVIFHVSIAALLNLGIFPFAMLALYPCFVHPDEWWWVKRG